MDEVLAHYAEIDRALPIAFLDELDATLKFLRRYPNAGASFHVVYRRLVLRRFPYLIVYRVTTRDRSARILAIVHGARDPRDVLAQVRQRG